MKRFALLLSLILCALGAAAITPPPPVTPTIASVLYSWDAPTSRVDNTPLAASEIKEFRLYITSLPTLIAIPATAKTYTYVIPSGQCILAADGAALTAVDASGLESSLSNIVQLSADRCSGKSRPGAPGNVKAQ